MAIPEDIKNKIDSLSQEDMCRLWRFVPLGEGYFKDREIGEYFARQLFTVKGGFTPEISKKIG